MGGNVCKQHFATLSKWFRQMYLTLCYLVKVLPTNVFGTLLPCKSDAHKCNRHSATLLK